MNTFKYSQDMYRALDNNQPVLKLVYTNGTSDTTSYIYTDATGKKITGINFEASALKSTQEVNVGTIANPRFEKSTLRVHTTWDCTIVPRK